MTPGRTGLVMFKKKHFLVLFLLLGKSNNSKNATKAKPKRNQPQDLFLSLKIGNRGNGNSSIREFRNKPFFSDSRSGGTSVYRLTDT